MYCKTILFFGFWCYSCIRKLFTFQKEPFTKNITTTIDDKIKDEKQQYDINREAAQTSALSSGKIDKYEFVIDKEILSSDQSRIIEQAHFTYSQLSETFEKQMKTIEDHGIKQVQPLKASKPEENWELESIEGIFLKRMRNNKFKNKINLFQKWEEKTKLKDLIYRANKYKYDFTQFETIRSFSGSIYTGKIATNEIEIDQAICYNIW